MGKAGGMEASVTLVDIELTDVRPEAKNNAYRWDVCRAPPPPPRPRSLSAGVARGQIHFSLD